MNRPAQSLLITLIGGTLLWISVFTRSYLKYVKPYFYPALIASGVVLVILGITTLVRCWRVQAAQRSGGHGHGEDGHGEHGHGEHGHGEHGPKVAWLLGMPVLAVFLLAPPALGSYAAGRDTTPGSPPASSTYPPLPLADAPTDMYVGEFVGRSYLDDGRTLYGRDIRLIGFAAPRKGGGWYLTRIQISCCAADARAWKIRIQGAAEPPDDTWVQVTGTWIPRRPGDDPTAPPGLTATSIRRTEEPESPYEEY